MIRPPDGADFEQWAWPGHKTHQAIRRTPILIPIVLGNLLSGRGGALSNGIGVPPETWHITPDGLAPLGRSFTFTPNTTHRVIVRVSWIRNGKDFYKDVEFELRFFAPGQEPEFVQVSRRWRSRGAFRRLTSARGQ